MIYQKKAKQSNGIVKKIVGGLACAGVIGSLLVIPTYIMVREASLQKKKENKRELEIKAMAIGIYKDIEKIEDITDLEYHGKKEKPGFYVLFKDKKIMKYLNITNGGDPEEVEDISDRFWWFNGPKPYQKKK